ncbi:18279_t:CDS:2, partial [Gigaspora rosea]
MEYVLKTSDTIDTSTVEAGRTFATFHEARATQIDSVIILGKTTKNPDNIYRQAHFACEKQEKYIRKNDAYTMKRIGCPFVISINYCKRNKEFAITRSCLEHNHEVCSDATKFSTVVRKLNQDDLGLIETLHSNGLRTKDIFSVLNSVLLNAFNDEQDQDGAFMQAIFWAYRNAISEFSVGKDIWIYLSTGICACLLSDTEFLHLGFTTVKQSSNLIN